MAQRIETERRTAGGLEDLLDLAAVSLFVVGILLAVVVLAWQRLLGVAPAIMIVINSAIAWLLFRSIAEIIRLQKKQAGLPYGGKISGGEQLFGYKCGDCGMMLHSESRCDSCGAIIENA